jgi:hypothetical protein
VKTAKGNACVMEGKHHDEPTWDFDNGSMH